MSRLYTCQRHDAEKKLSRESLSMSVRDWLGDLGVAPRQPSD